MSLTIPGVTSELVPIPLQVFDADGAPVEGLFPRAQIMPENGSPTPVDEVDLAEVDGGLYSALWPIPASAKYLVRFQIFTDAARTVLATDYVFDQPDLIVADQAAAQPPSLIASGVDPTL